MKRYNLTVPHESKDGKTYWNNVGVMFQRDKGGYSIVLSMFPDLSIMAFPVEEKKQDEGRSSDSYEDPNF